MPSDNILTQDELDFLRAMQDNPELNVPDTTPGLVIDGSAQIKDLLARLVAHEQVTIEAHLEKQQISFPLQVVEDEFHAGHLQLGAPSIYEDGPMLRPWRMTLAEPAVLEDDTGRISNLWIREISFKGVLVEARNGEEAPEQLSGWFHPLGHAPIALRGTLIRRPAEGLFAYRLNQNADIEKLRQYILQQHKVAHPQLHAAPFQG